MDRRIAVLALTAMVVGILPIAFAPTASACDAEMACELIDLVDSTDEFLRECLVELHEKLGM